MAKHMLGLCVHMIAIIMVAIPIGEDSETRKLVAKYNMYLLPATNFQSFESRTVTFIVMYAPKTVGFKDLPL